MKTTAVRLYGKDDLRLETFELPPIKDDEVQVKVMTDSICMSSYKAAKQGGDHKRVPDNVAENPVMIGHEFSGVITQVGKKWQDKFKEGQNFVIQPAHNYKGSLMAPGYSYPYCGGDATYCNIPMEIMETDCLLPWESDVYFHGSLAEPLSCVIGAFRAQYHTKVGTYEHEMGIVEGGKMAMLASVGPMGLAAIELAIHGPKKPGLLVITDINQERLDRAASIYTVEEAKKQGIEIVYLNTGEIDDPVGKMMEISGGTGFDDVFVFAPVKPVVEQGDAILARDGCLNFFAGPTDPEFRATMNFYNVHYGATHVVGTTGGNNEDMRIAVELMGKGMLDPSPLVTHIGGLKAVAETTLNLPNIPGGKKLIYPHIDIPLTALDDFAEKGKEDPVFAALAEITEKHNGLWSAEAEKYLLEHCEEIA